MAAKTWATSLPLAVEVPKSRRPVTFGAEMQRGFIASHHLGRSTAAAKNGKSSDILHLGRGHTF